MRALLPDRAPDAPLAIDDAGQRLHYGDLDDLGAHWRAALPPRSLVVLQGRNRVDHLAAFLGLMLAGHVPVPVSKGLPGPVLTDLAERFGANALVTDADGPQLRLLADTPPALHPDLALCLSTSGSTGSPKLVRLSAEALAANARAIAHYLGLTEDERPLAHLPLEYSFGLSVVTSHLAAGACVRLTDESVMARPFWAALADCTSLAGVPFHYEMLARLRLDRQDLPKLRTLTQAGGKLSVDLVRHFHALAEARGWRFHIMYGQTEAGPRIAWLPHEQVSRHPDAIGGPIPGVALRLEEGELVVESPAIMMGYAETAADLARADDIGGLLRTGDLAEEVSPGLYRITGRKSRFIKLQGNRVGLADVETALQAAGFEAWCVGRDDRLFIATPADPDKVRAAALDRFAFPARSVTIRQIAEPPRRDNGKLDYARLRDWMDDAGRG